MLTYHEEENVGKRAIMLLLGPFVGLAYVIVLPFISIAAMIALLGRKVLGGVFNLLGHLVSFGWRPGEAYLGGKKKDKKKNDNANDT